MSAANVAGAWGVCTWCVGRMEHRYAVTEAPWVVATVQEARTGGFWAQTPQHWSHHASREEARAACDEALRARGWEVRS